MKLRQALTYIPGLREIIGRLDLRTGLSKDVLYSAGLMTGTDAIACETDKIEIAGRLGFETNYRDVTAALARVKDIRTSIGKLAGMECLTDIDLFEIKSFAFVFESLRRPVLEADAAVGPMPDLRRVIEILDPDRTGIPHFTIYDSYSAELADIRKKIRTARAENLPSGRIDELYEEADRIENQIRENLSAQLIEFHDKLLEAQYAAAVLDIALAKRTLSIQSGLTRPETSEDITSFEGLFNPVIAGHLAAAGKEYQPTDLAIGPGPVVITGANMGGKTITLQTAALAQAMFQYGFHVPAKRAVMVPADEIIISSGDGQDHRAGISSFGAEVRMISSIISKIKNGYKPMVLLDEPARTTNPDEGRAIVNAIIGMLARYRIPSLVTTHYGGIAAPCRRIRVKGIDTSRLESHTTDLNAIMDYSLIEDNLSAPPHDALTIARILGADDEFITAANEYLKQPQETKYDKE